MIAGSGWFAARPSGTEDIYKIYAESFSGADHLQRILKEAQAIVDRAIAHRPLAPATRNLALPAAPQASDDALLDRLQRAAFDYFLQNANPQQRLIADTTRDGAPSSIAVVGFALSAYPVGVEHGWIERADAVERTLAALRFFMASDQSGGPDATGYRGFYFHFLDMQSGTRVWLSEVSLIDTAFLMAGVLTAAAYFTADNAGRDRVAPPRRCALPAASTGAGRSATARAVMHGWKPECGFLHYGWEGYSEAILLYVLGLGSPTHPLTEQSFRAWTVTYQWENLYGYDFLYAGPLFIHQFSHAWIDFRGIQDDFMREKGCDYFENSRRATYVQREYAIRNPHSFAGYARDCWGLSAGDGPSAEPRLVAGRRQAFYGYAARGVPYGPDDGTICRLVDALVTGVRTRDRAAGAAQHGGARSGRRRRMHSRQRLQPDGQRSRAERLDLGRHVRPRPGDDRADDRKLPLRPASGGSAAAIPHPRRPAPRGIPRRLAVASAPRQHRHARSSPPRARASRRGSSRSRAVRQRPAAGWRNPRPASRTTCWSSAPARRDWSPRAAPPRSAPGSR